LVLLNWSQSIAWLASLSSQEFNMGYKVLDTTDMMRTKYGPRKGLEGPFNFSGKVLYYCNKEGAYYDPTTDFYVEQAEMDLINQRLVDILSK
jgi:hypothetical protein